MRLNRRLGLIGLVAICLALAACGSRRPLNDFVATTAGATTGTQGASAAGPAASAAANANQVGSGSAVVSGGGPAAVATNAASGAASRGSATGGAVAADNGGAAAGVPNTASDVGLTPTTITVGNIVTKSGSFGPDQFTSFYYGAAAFFDYVNDHGGIHGRKVVFQTCDDKGSPVDDNNCARSLAGDGTNGVFAFVGNDCLVCDGLRYVSSKKIPQVGGLAIDFQDYALPYTWRYSGDMYPQNGKIGYQGNLYEGTQLFHYFKVKVGMTKAAVVYYDNSAQSKEAGDSFIKALQAEGVQAYPYGENVALPQWDSAVLDMKSKGVQVVFDSIDISGNQNLCKSIDSNHLVLKAKVSTVSTWAQSVGTTFHYPCRSYIYSAEVPGTLGYDQTSNPEIAKFRAAMKQYFPDREDKMYQWNVDGWASAMWFADAAESCGAKLTRSCLIAYLDRAQPYAAHGIWWPRNNAKFNFETKKSLYYCISVAHWDEARKSFATVGDQHNTCYTTPYIPYAAPPSSS